MPRQHRNKAYVMEFVIGPVQVEDVNHLEANKPNLGLVQKEALPVHPSAHREYGRWDTFMRELYQASNGRQSFYLDR
jgi:hypothetical protein